ncbi:MAG: MFS transporter, partial [Bacteroidota bacterium]
MTSAPVSKRAHRWAVAAFFFLAGLSFASWASRIPDIKAALHMSDAVLGGVLFALPAGSILSLLLSGWLITKHGSKKTITVAAICYPIILIFIGNASTIWQLVPFVFLYGLLGNICNISMNTQAVGVENLYGRSIMASFHGIWSLAGFTGAAIGTVAVSKNLSPFFHFCVVAGTSILLILYTYQFT